MAALFFFLVLTFLSVLFHQPTEAVHPMTDRNRVISTFDRSYDSCRDVTNTSGHESKKAADGMCEEAFKALDRLRINMCNDWRDAKCRFIDDNYYAQCTCRSSLSKDQSVGSDRVKAFRECAKDLRMPEQNTGQAPALTQNFQEIGSSQNTVRNAARSRLASNRRGPYDRAGSSRNVYTKGGASSPWDAFTSRFEGPSTEFPSYAPGASGTRISEPRTGGLDLNNLPEDHVCHQCGSEFISSRAYFVHKIVYHTDSDTNCDFCTLTYNSRKTLLAHIRIKHPDIAAEIKAEELKSAKFACEDCGKLLKTKRSLIDHRKSHNTMETYCSKCDQILATKQGYKIHLKAKHPEIAKSEADAAQLRYIAENPRACDYCPKRFKTSRSLRDHVPFHNGGTTCDECGAILTSKSSLATHKRIEHPNS